MEIEDLNTLAERSSENYETKLEEAEELKIKLVSQQYELEKNVEELKAEIYEQKK